MSTSEGRKDRLAALAEQAIAQTESGKIAWQSTDRRSSFTHIGQSASIVISQISYEKFFPPTSYKLSILNPDGEEVDFIESDTNLSSGASAYGVLADLYAAAREDALNVDKVIDDIFREIEG